MTDRSAIPQAKVDQLKPLIQRYFPVS
jgi:hypothetical protein